MTLHPASRPLARRERALRIAVALVAVFTLACRGEGPAEAAPDATQRRPGRAAAKEEVQSPELARLGDGLVAWESSRSGAWRIWIRKLDGSGLRQLSPDEPGREHCCAHLSPDGRHVAYLSLAGAAYGTDDEAGRLYLVPAAGGAPRLLAEGARTYGRGHRAGVWHGPESFQYIDANADSLLLDLNSGQTQRLAGPDEAGRGWLVDPTRRWATTGVPTFSPLQAAAGRVDPRSPFGGCEPNLSDDGRWGLWVAGAGGPLRRIELASRATSDLIVKNDPRLPGRSYLYFPALSNDRLLLTFAASAGEHDHTTGDYDVFVVAVDPRTLDLLGEPLRYTSHRASDRYPTVWAAPLPLGRHLGEAPHTVELTAPAGRTWAWDFGDGAPPRTGGGRHTYARPGTYVVEARAGEERLRGQVTVEAPRPPRVLGLAVRESELLVRFDEPVAVQALEARLESGTAITGQRLSDDGQGLTLTLAAPLAGPDRLRLAGVRDRAQSPNVLPAATLEVPAPLWPSDRSGLAFLWQTADQPNLVQHPQHGGETAYALTARGRARLDRHQAMVLDGGAWAAGDDAGASIVELVRRSAQLSLELTLQPRRLDQKGTVVALAAPRGRPNLLLSQQGRSLRLQLRLEGAVHTAEVAKLAGARPAHLVVTYTPGRLVAYLDGKQVLATEVPQGDFFQWKPAPLVFGDRAGGGSDWAGTLEGIALYDRALTADEVAENHRRYARERERRPDVAELRVRGTLLRRSRVPRLDEIAPYREALAVHEVRVDQVLAGAAPGPVLRVARWVILDGQPQPAGRQPQGSTVELVLEPYAAQPQLEPLYVSDQLGPQPAGPLLFDAGG